MPKKVFISGCFDLFHSGHLAFLESASAYGDLYVSIGSDATICGLKGRRTITTEKERLYIIKSIRYVHDAFISSGHGQLDFVDDIMRISPDIFIVNYDGDLPEKRNICNKLGIQYVVLPRLVKDGLPTRSSTALRHNNMPYRIDLAGGWLDQPFVSSMHSGCVVVASIEPNIEFNIRSGMASSTRAHAIELWGPEVPLGNNELLARELFCYDNPPGSTEISGSQDAIGIVYPNVNKLYYDGQYWPSKIESTGDLETINFINNIIYLVPLDPREKNYDVLSNKCLMPTVVAELADAANECWDGIISRNIDNVGRAMVESFNAQIKLFPNMINDSILSIINDYKSIAAGWKLSGAGGGGYIIIVSEYPINNAIRVEVRRG